MQWKVVILDTPDFSLTIFGPGLQFIALVNCVNILILCCVLHKGFYVKKSS